MITNIIQFLHTTTAYQTAALQLMIGEANYAVKQLDLKEPLPIVISTDTNKFEVFAPPMGVRGSVLASNYWFSFERGRLAWIKKWEWEKRTSPAPTNLVEWARQTSAIDTNGAYQLATQWLASLSIDVPKLEKENPAHIIQRSVPVTVTNQTGKTFTEQKLIPIFEIGWSQQPPRLNYFFSSSTPVRLKILGTTKELVEFRIGDGSLFRNPPLQVTNAAELLGPLPPPRHFVEQLMGGKHAYETIANPERAEAWLLKTYEEGGYSTNKVLRTGATKMNAKTAKRFSDPLLNFNSYAWTVQKMCSPDFGARLRFTRGNDAVEFLLCFECDILEVTYNGRTHVENFDYGHNELVRALQAVFPKDKVVKKLEFNTDKPNDLLKLFQSL